MSRCVERVDERLKDFPHILHSKLFSWLRTKAGGSCNNNHKSWASDFIPGSLETFHLSSMIFISRWEWTFNLSQNSLLSANFIKIFYISSSPSHWDYLYLISESLIYLRVDIHVLLQADCMAKGFSANAAAKRSHSAVRSPNVNLQPMRCWEHLQHS